MDHPNATWEQFAKAVINKDLSYTVTTALTGGESHADPIIQEMRDDLKGIKLLIKEQMNNTINAVEKTVDPNATGRRMATRFCGYCRTNGHTPNWCRKKMRDEEVKKVQNKANTERRITFTNDYNKRTGPDLGMAQDFRQDYPIQRSENIWRLHINWHLRELCKQPLHGTDLIDHRIETLTQNADLQILDSTPVTRDFRKRVEDLFPIILTVPEAFLQDHRELHLLLTSTETSLTLSVATYNLFHQGITQFFRDNNKTEMKDPRFPKTNDMGRSNAVQFLGTDYSVNLVADFRPLNY